MSYDGRADTARVIPAHPLVISYRHEITHASKVIYKVAGSVRTLGYLVHTVPAGEACLSGLSIYVLSVYFIIFLLATTPHHYRVTESSCLAKPQDWPSRIPAQVTQRACLSLPRRRVPASHHIDWRRGQRAQLCTKWIGESSSFLLAVLAGKSSW